MKSKVIFWIILTLAFVLRFYKLGEIPLSLDWDENSNVYNAYSILKTGRDEYGVLFPITNRSFDDYKPPLYMYLNIPTVAIFGLTPIAARFPSALFGFLTVPTIYFLAKKLFENYKYNKLEIGNWKLEIPEIAMLFLAISPWHIQFSRVGFEATVGLFFATAAITLFLYGLENKKWLIVSSICLGISAYTYHTQRIFVPLLFITTFFIFKEKILAISKRYLLLFAIITVLIGLPLIILIPPKVILQRFEVTTGRPRLEDIEKSIKFILQDRQMGLDFGNVIHNRRFLIGQTYVNNYLSHFDFNFLFTKGDDNFRHHIQDMGMLYLFEFPLIVFGIYHLIKNHDKKSTFIILWLIIAPIAASPATPNPHGNRSLPMIIALELISAYSLVTLYSQKFLFKKALLAIFTIWIVSSFLVYLHNYYVHYPIEKASFWQYGYKEAVIESEKLKEQYAKINVDHSLEQAYVFWLFNTKYDPESYQATGSRHYFDKYYFDAKPPTRNNELFISDAGVFPKSFETIKIIYYPNGDEAIKIGHPR